MLDLLCFSSQLSDGAPDCGQETKPLIVEKVCWLDTNRLPLNEVGLSYVQNGNDQEPVEKGKEEYVLSTQARFCNQNSSSTELFILSPTPVKISPSFPHSSIYNSSGEGKGTLMEIGPLTNTSNSSIILITKFNQAFHKIQIIG
ncbi:hypothetical protein O181_103537 [Austropuccinia psidii MF-1]|uniref:Uncharacterized protein n=1 Tax=Austropuccinia psidii MF-1 TaxID=1389203 RepID=A0A9Q3JLC9_9BASI|nr:hypothetical protein [Austropuccinia psidii MF-1]